MKRMRSLLLVGLCLLSTLAGAFAQEILLGTTSGAAGSLYSINPTTGAATSIGFLQDGIGDPFGVTGLAWDSLTGVLYGSTSNNSGTTPGALVTIDPNTGTVTLIGAFATSGPLFTMSDLTFDATTGNLYGVSALTGDLYTINMLTGLAVPVGNAGFAPLSTTGNGLAASSGGTLFGTPTGANGTLFTYSKSDGSVTSVGTLSGAPIPTGAINALAFDGAGTLFGVNIDNGQGGSKNTHLITINTTTGAITDVGASVNSLDAIVFISPIPEPTTTALLGAGMVLLTLAGLRRYRRSLS
jgi:hypothetical protein